MGAGIHAVPVLFLCFNLIDEQMSWGFLKGSFMVFHWRLSERSL